MVEPDLAALALKFPLKACAHCGSRAEFAKKVTQAVDWWHARCIDADCSMQTQGFGLPVHAAKAWNRRPVDQDAERWRALMSSQRIRMMGSAGFDSKNGHWVPRPGAYLHLGVEIWDIHEAYGNPEYPDSHGRKTLEAYVDELRARGGGK